MMRICKVARLSIIAFAFSATVALSQSRGEKMSKPYFFVNENFGSIALIDGANSRFEGDNLRDYTYFESEGQCYLIPEQDRYRFVINHRLPSESPKEWFSFVTIVYHEEGNGEFIALYRNGGWLSENGEELGQYYGDSHELGLSPRHFVDLHIKHETNRERNEAKREFNEIAGKFHGKLRRTSLNSWSLAPRMAAPLHSDFPDLKFLSVNLYKYTITKKRASKDPVDFVVPRYKASKFTIIAETPGIGGPPITTRRTFVTKKERCAD